MDENSHDAQGRRRMLKSAAWLGALAVLPVLSVPRKAMGADKLAKTAVQYQDKPNAGKDCDDCIQYVPGAKRGGPGTCKIVEGEISPHGYCIAFAPKPKRG